MKVNLDISSLTSFAFVVHFLSVKRPTLDQDLLTEKPSHKFLNREKAKKAKFFTFQRVGCKQINFKLRIEYFVDLKS